MTRLSEDATEGQASGMEGGGQAAEKSPSEGRGMDGTWRCWSALIASAGQCYPPF